MSQLLTGSRASLEIERLAECWAGRLNDVGEKLALLPSRSIRAHFQSLADRRLLRRQLSALVLPMSPHLAARRRPV